MRAPHWCYVYRINGPKLLVIPTTSIKPESGPAREPYELDIIEGDGRTGRLHFDEMRSIDKMRIVNKKVYIDVLTPREVVENALKTYLNL